MGAAYELGHVRADVPLGFGKLGQRLGYTASQHEELEG
jgi:hypothetical protein